MTAVSATRTCCKCRAVKPKADFAVITGHTGRVVRRKTCDACRVRRYGPYSCIKCHELLPMDAYPRMSNGARNMRCMQCLESKSGRLKKCNRCGKTKPNSEFPRISSGCFSPRCIQCHEANGPARRLFLLPDPCSQCGGQMWSSRAKQSGPPRKFCSRPCTHASKRTGQVKCTQCLKVLPRGDFPRRMPRTLLEAKCMPCISAIQRGRVSLRAGHSAYSNIRRRMHDMAKRQGIAEPLSRRAAQRFIEQPCTFCAAETECFTLRWPQDLLSAENMLPCCMRCRDLQRHRPADELVEWARMVTRQYDLRHPDAKTVRPPKTAYSRQLARALANKGVHGQDIVRNKLVPPDVQSMAPIGETFEQKVARYAKARAELAEAGKRAKTGDDADAV